MEFRHPVSDSSLPTKNLVRLSGQLDVRFELEKLDPRPVVELDDASGASVLHEPAALRDEHVIPILAADAVPAGRDWNIHLHVTEVD